MGYSYSKNTLTGNVLLEGTLGGRDISADGAALDQVIQDVSEIDPVLATLDKSFLENEEATITLVSPAISPSVAVTKEVAQTGVTSNRWNVGFNDAYYDQQDLAGNDTLTPDGTTGTITLSLGVGSFVTADLGARYDLNGGSCVLIDTAGVASVISDLTDTSTAASGEWQKYGTKTSADGLGLEVSSVATGPFSLSEIFDTGDTLSGLSVNAIDIYMRPDGLAFFVLVESARVEEYTISVAFDVTTASLSGNTFSVPYGRNGIDFKRDGTVMYFCDFATEEVLAYALSPAWDITSASLSSTTSVLANPLNLALANDGTKLYVIDNLQLAEYDLSTPYSFSSVAYVRSNDAVATSIPRGLYVDNSGAFLLMIREDADSIYRYDFGTAFDISTLSLVDSYSVAADGLTRPAGLAVHPDGSYVYILDYSTTPRSVTEFQTQSLVGFINTRVTATTKASSQIDTDYWTDLNALTIDDALNSQTALYSFSTDGGATWFVSDATGATRNIARDNAGAWEVNTNATFGAETWAAAATNSKQAAISEATETVAANQMTSATVNALTDGQLFALGVTLDLAVTLESGTSTFQPVYNGATLDYDANVLNEGAILGTDYDYDQPETDKVRIKSLKAQNLKVRVV
jgi:sugar lactone lactonase YvrE